MIKIYLAIILFGGFLIATDKFDPYFVEAGKAFDVPPLLLKKIATIESGLNPKALGKNKNGTYDYGLMQINSIHLKKFQKQYGMTKEQLMDTKINIHVGAKLISGIIARHGFSFEAIGRYHSNTPEFKKKWNKKLITELKKSLQQNGGNG